MLGTKTQKWANNCNQIKGFFYSFSIFALAAQQCQRSEACIIVVKLHSVIIYKNIMN